MPSRAVGVLEPDDVVELRRRDLEDVVSSSAVTRCTVPGRKWNACARPRSRPLSRTPSPGVAELELARAPLDVPGLVLLVVELEAERLARADEEDLPAVAGR